MSSAVVNKNRFRKEQKYVVERIAQLREELERLGRKPGEAAGHDGHSRRFQGGLKTALYRPA